MISLPANKRYPVLILVFSSIWIFILFLWQGARGFNLADEGYLWYGAQRVLLGEVPIRDFSSYDPGRYYWLAALMRLWGDNGIMALRGAVAVFQMFGLACGLLLIAKSADERRYSYLLLSAVVLSVWMWPYYRLIDISLSILLVSALSCLLHNPTGRRFFFAGLGVGLVAVFGRNHGLYGLAGSIGAIAWLNIRRDSGSGPLKGLALWAGGVATGFLPTLLMVLTVPGFAEAFGESIRYSFELKATNIPLPVPWPWSVNFASLPPGVALRGVLVGLFFIATVVFGVLSLIWVFRAKLYDRQVPPALVAAACLALPYAHYAYARADVEHLALGIFPLLLGCLVLLAGQPAKFRWPLGVVLCAASLWVMYPEHPGWQSRAGGNWVDAEISGSDLTIGLGTAQRIDLLRTLADVYAPNGREFIAVPFMPGAYPLLSRRSPLHEIYPLLPRGQEFQQREIERIKAADPGFILMVDLPLDGREELRFRHTHARIYQFIVDNYQLLPTSPDPAYHIYIPGRPGAPGY